MNKVITETARPALDRLVRRSRGRPPADAVALVAEARIGLLPRE